ncbi:MAG: serine/threonine-protein phosphatase [Alphaproteobacteria bacterium]|nr:serine/threonine-protein phosphatase [Alphaproteobacteria bacterium]
MSLVTVLLIVASAIIAVVVCLVIGLVVLQLVWRARSAREVASPPAPAPQPASAPPPAAVRSSSLPPDQLGPMVDDDDDVTMITVSVDGLVPPPRPARPAPVDPFEAFSRERTGEGETVPIVTDPEAEVDGPTLVSKVFLVSAAGQTDTGRRRTENQDRYAVLDQHHLYVVADGMGGYQGGEIAAQLACDTITEAFEQQRFDFPLPEDVSRRAGELAVAIQMANRAIHERAASEPELKSMGTTVVCARFAPRNERLYIGHVGDSRCYRLRNGEFRQLTTDHTMGNLGFGGKVAHQLSRALGVDAGVKVDLLLCKPRVDDIYVLCSDGLTKMVKDDAVIARVLTEEGDAEKAVQRLVRMANNAGGKDNVTVVLIAVRDIAGFQASLST